LFIPLHWFSWQMFSSVSLACAACRWDIQQASQRTHHVMAPFVDLFNHSAASKTEVGALLQLFFLQV
jgi:hypothetical protein